MFPIAVALASVLSTSQVPPAEFAAPRDHVFQSPHAVAVADFNRDGKRDVAVVNVYHQSVTVVFNGGEVEVVAVGSFPRDVALGDFNGDFRPDLAVANSGGSTVSVVLGNSDGTFQPAVNVVTGMEPWSVAVADFNGDGRHDLAVGNRQSNDLAVLLGNGDGTFRPSLSVPLGGAPTAIVAADFNQDLRADVAVAVGPNVVSVLRGTGLGTFQPALDTRLDATYIADFATGDFTSDGRVDLAVADPESRRLHVLPGDGSGTFGLPRPVTNISFAFHSIVAGDFNEDSKLDLLSGGWYQCFCENNTGAQLFRGEGDGTFAPPSVAIASGAVYSVAAGDLDGDQNLDLVTASLRTNGVSGPPSNFFPLGTVSVRFGRGDGSFVQTRGAGGQVSEPRSADFNGDGRVDIASVVRTSSGCEIAVSLSRGDGSFRVLPLIPYPSWRCGLFAVGDFNGDSRPDLAVAVVAGIVALLGNGDGTFTTGPTSASELDFVPLHAADVGRDGYFDLAYIDVDISGTQRIYLQIGNGDGSFGPPMALPQGSEHALVGLELADLTGDGRLDLALITGAPDPVSLMAGNGDGTFQPPIDFASGVGAGDRPSTITAADVNGDGGTDLIVGNGNSGSVSLLLADGAGSLLPHVTYYTPYMPRAVAVADANGDRTPDLLVLNSNTVSILLGQGDGTLSLQPVGFATLENSRTLIVGDFTSDGKPDVIVDSVEGRRNGLALLVNVTPAASVPISPE